MNILIGIGIPAIRGGGAGNGAAYLITSDANAFAIDFLSNTYAINVNNGADSLIFNDQIGFSIDFTDNSYAVKN